MREGFGRVEEGGLAEGNVVIRENSKLLDTHNKPHNSSNDPWHRAPRNRIGRPYESSLSLSLYFNMCLYGIYIYIYCIVFKYLYSALNSGGCGGAFG